MITIDEATIRRALQVAASARQSEPSDTLAYFQEWAADDPAEAGQVAFILAVAAGDRVDLAELAYRVNLPADVREAGERAAHAAYCRGVEHRTPAVVRGENNYQRRIRGDKRRLSHRRTQVMADVTAIKRAQDELPPPAERTAIRQAAGVSCSQIARACNVDKSAASKWERGERYPTGKRLIAYVAVLKSLRDTIPTPTLEISEEAA